MNHFMILQSSPPRADSSLLGMIENMVSKKVNSSVEKVEAKQLEIDSSQTRQRQCGTYLIRVSLIAMPQEKLAKLIDDWHQIDPSFEI